MKKLLSLALAMLMLVTSALATSANAFAYSSLSRTIVEPSYDASKASVDVTTWAQFCDAFKNNKSGATITLKANITQTLSSSVQREIIPSSGAYLINLNGYKMDLNDTNAYGSAHSLFTLNNATDLIFVNNTTKSSSLNYNNTSSSAITFRIKNAAASLHILGNSAYSGSDRSIVINSTCASTVGTFSTGVSHAPMSVYVDNVNCSKGIEISAAKVLAYNYYYDGGYTTEPYCIYLYGSNTVNVPIIISNNGVIQANARYSEQTYAINVPSNYNIGSSIDMYNGGIYGKTIFAGYTGTAKVGDILHSSSYSYPSGSNTTLIKDLANLFETSKSGIVAVDKKLYIVGADGEYFYDKNIASLASSYLVNHKLATGSSVKDATCLDDGWRKTPCTNNNCTYEKVEVLTKLGHDPVSANNAVEPKCTVNGKESDTICSRCGTTLATGATITKTGHKEIAANNAVAPTCTVDGKSTDMVCEYCGIVMTPGSTVSAFGHTSTTVPAVAPTCTDNGASSYEACKTCGAVLTTAAVIPATGHSFGDNAQACTVCGTANPSYVAPAPAPADPTPAPADPTPTPEAPQQTVEQKVNEIASQYGVSADTLALTDSSITSAKGDADLKGSDFGKLQLKQAKADKSSIKVSWSKVAGADGYIVYANTCGSKLKKVKTVKAGTTSYTQKKLKKGTYYKYVVVAYKNVDGQQVTLAASKTIHATTAGGKYGNPKAVKLGNVKKNKLTIKKGKTFTVKASQVKADKTIKKHTAIKFETSNKAIATVDSKGKISAKKKGTCKVYVYAQNGVAQTITVTVK